VILELLDSQQSDLTKRFTSRNRVRVEEWFLTYGRDSIGCSLSIVVAVFDLGMILQESVDRISLLCSGMNDDPARRNACISLLSLPLCVNDRGCSLVSNSDIVFTPTISDLKVMIFDKKLID